MAQIERALLMPDKADFRAMTALVGSIMSQYNAAVNNARKKGPRGSQ